MQNTTASWTMVHEAGDALEVRVKIYQGPTMARYAIFASKDGQEEKWVDIIAREGAWYVYDGRKACKCRPFEAPMDIPVIYPLLVRSWPGIPDAALLESKGTLKSVTANVATYRVPLEGAARRQCEMSLRQMDNILQQAAKEGTSARIPETVQQAKRLAQEFTDAWYAD